MLHLKLYLKSSDLNAYKVAKEINGKVLDVKNGFHTEAVITKEIPDILPLKLTQTRLIKKLKSSLTRMVTYVDSNELCQAGALYREETIIVICNKSQMEKVCAEFIDYELVDVLHSKNLTMKFYRRLPIAYRFSSIISDRSITVIRRDVLQDKSYV